MPATNYTPIQLYRSTTSGNIPNAANLSAGEIALNIADNDMTMYFENASGTVKSFFNNPAALKYPTADGTSGQIIQTNGAGVLSFGSAPSSALTNNTRQAVTSAATTAIDLNSGNVIDLTMADNITTLSFTNVPASGTPILIQIVVRNASDGTAYTIAWPNSVYWSGQYAATTSGTVQTAPTLATGNNGITVIALLTTDGGTKWRGWVEATIPGLNSYKLYGWGVNTSFGNVGNNSSSNVATPTQIGALLNWAEVSDGNQHSLAVKLDGTLWSWGYFLWGALGLNTGSINVSSPTQIGSLTSWVSASASNNMSFGLRSNGTIWSWGQNVAGALGQNDNYTNRRSSPTQIGSLNTWVKITANYSGASAIKSDGTLWVWGTNGNGALGLNDSVSRSSPVQLGSASNWSKLVKAPTVSTRGAITTGNELYLWGFNGRGGLGQNNLVDASSPVQVGSGVWAEASMGWNACVAVQTDGTLWAWGNNDKGQLGLNDIVNRSSPVQIGSASNWSKTTANAFNYACAFAIKTTGTLWAWGNNNTGQLGLNDSVARSSPSQVGSASNWIDITVGGARFAHGITFDTVNPAA